MEQLLLIPIMFLIIYGVRVIVLSVFIRECKIRNVIACGFLVSCQLSFFIAMSDVGMRLGVVDEITGSVMVVFAILSCYISTYIFETLYQEEDKR